MPLGNRKRAPSYNAELVEQYAGPAQETGVLNSAYPVGDIRRFGAVGDGVTDDTAAIQKTINATVASGGGVVVFPAGTFKVTATLTITSNKVVIRGAGWNGCNVNFTGSGELFRIGTDDGLSWDLGNYNGVQGVSFSDLALRFTGSGVALNNGLANYGAGTYAIRDWRGGQVRLDRVLISGFDYWFWGVQSDLNRFYNCIISFCHSGGYFGPRSDQATLEHLWSFGNDVVFWFEGCASPLVRHWTTDHDGSTTTCPVIATASIAGLGANGSHFAGTRIASGLVFDVPWLENLSGGAVIDVPAFFDLGNGDTTQNGSIVIRDPIVFVQFYNTGGLAHTLLLCRVGNWRSVHVEGATAKPGQVPLNNLRAVFSVLASGAGGGATTPYLFFFDRDVTTMRVVENYHASAVKLHIRGDLDATYTNNVVGGTGTVTMLGGRNAPKQVRTGTATWDPTSIAVGASLATTIAVVGAALGDTVIASLARDLLGLTISGYVNATDSVTVVLVNNTAGAVDLGSATLRVDVIQH